MKLFDSELQYLSELYQRLKVEILASTHPSGGNDATAAESLLRNRELLSRIEQMTERTTQLAQEWDKFQLILDPQSKTEIQALAASVRSQAVQLEQLCKGLARQIERRRNSLEQSLAELQKGTRYINSVRPPTTNYPKFIDSVG
ncbi:MAG TPA: hypothetical protein VE398_05335 [Acidobacteriota bacterium]|nr:hypothetical protein [Acidobacteriota bacterium]